MPADLNVLILIQVVLKSPQMKEEYVWKLSELYALFGTLFSKLFGIVHIVSC